jgi:hypothetical protein
MNVTLTLDDELVKKVRKIAVERDTTLTGLIREYLERLAPPEVSPEEIQRRRDALRRSFEELQFDSGGEKWTREQRNERPSKYLGTRS